MKNKTFFLVLAIFGFSVCGLAQASSPKGPPVLTKSATYDPSEDFVVGDVRGTVKSKAVYLHKPEYPVEARWLGNEGTVRVQISIDEEGNVLTATALAGEMPLVAVAEHAARRSKFVIARDETGQPVNAHGVLVYSFEIKKAGWSKIGNGLTLNTRIPSHMLSIPAAIKALPPEWTSERQMFEEIQNLRRTQPQVPQLPRPELVVVLRSLQMGSTGMAGMSKKIILPPIPPQPPDNGQGVIAQKLIAALQTRLADDQLNLWRFNLGLEITNIFERGPYGSGDAANIPAKFFQNAPSGAPEDILAALKTIGTKLGGKQTNVVGDEIRILVMQILRSK